MRGALTFMLKWPWRGAIFIWKDMEGNLILTGCLMLVAAKLVALDYLTTNRTGRNAILQCERLRLYVQRIPRDDDYIATMAAGLLQFEAELQQMLAELERPTQAPEKNDD